MSCLRTAIVGPILSATKYTTNKEISDDIYVFFFHVICSKLRVVLVYLYVTF